MARRIIIEFEAKPQSRNQIETDILFHAIETIAKHNGTDANLQTIEINHTTDIRVPSFMVEQRNSG